MRDRIAIIGAGHVGATTAYALMLRGLVHEIVLIDDNEALARAEAADLSDANTLARPCRIWAGQYDDACGASIAIITAGAATQGAQSRLSVAHDSGEIVAACVTQLMVGGFDGIILVATNPVDLMAQAAFQDSGLAPARVLGTGTLLDTSRLKQTLSAELKLSAGFIHGFVIGEHGDSEVAAFSAVRVGGMGLDAFTGERAQLDLVRIAGDVRDAAYGIIGGKGYTSFGIATAIVRICEAIVRDEKAVLPVSARLDGQYGLSDVFLSLPCVIGVGGVERILTPELSTAEHEGLLRSAATLKQAFAGL